MWKGKTLSLQSKAPTDWVSQVERERIAIQCVCKGDFLTANARHTRICTHTYCTYIYYRVCVCVLKKSFSFQTLISVPNSAFFPPRKMNGGKKCFSICGNINLGLTDYIFFAYFSWLETKKESVCDYCPYDDDIRDLNSFTTNAYVHMNRIFVAFNVPYFYIDIAWTGGRCTYLAFMYIFTIS